MGALGHSAPEAQQSYNRAYDLARALGEIHIAALAGSRLWLAEYGAGDLDGVCASADRVHREIGAACDAVHKALICVSASTAHLFQGRFVDADRVLLETAAVHAVRGRELAPVEYYFMSQVAQTATTRMVLHLIAGHRQRWREACGEMCRDLEMIGPVGGVIGLTVIIYTRYVAGDWDELPADLALFEQTVSQIGGADHYLDLAHLVRARLETRSGQPDGLAWITRFMASEGVKFAKQHLPRYQMIAGDAHADLGDLDGARGQYLSALEGGPHGSQQWLRSEVQRRLGDLEAASNVDRARTWYEEARQTARAQASALFEIRAVLSLARLAQAEGRPDGIAILHEACERLDGDGPDFDAARALLAAIEEQNGQPLPQTNQPIAT
jgi:tetratricopeptide (TPR) repeat protein